MGFSCGIRGKKLFPIFLKLAKLNVTVLMLNKNKLG